MIFETKLNIGDTMWFMLDNKAIYQEVKNIRIHSIAGDTRVFYSTHLEHTCSSDWFIKDEDVFKTKEELLTSL